ncbi:MAG: putative SOS response-associated peptidase YedK [Alphaproteobacteria bacterium MarineAlpha10_Bin3]|nr:MAG: putative SOS response-associated peptidase YedK [Alphaproteobacteria bacterium MarineAlpha10_Bin3]PPR74809.1 MAG: putative SOS response-associated peptidase YedK [Alphaproteobacteria bacterium MarineAlpha4_Bin1]
MCGRYSLTTPLESVERLFAFDARPNLAARYNIAPTQPVPVLRNGVSGRRELVLVRWGLVPSWAKAVSAGRPLINARAETVAEKPAFRNAFKRRRCLIPADGFYEWHAVPDGSKQPYRIAMADNALFAFAGIWEHWQTTEGSELETCAIVTTDANNQIRDIHHRMPVILAPGDFDAWLSGEPGAAATLMRPYGGSLIAYPVGRAVNDIRNDGPSLWDKTTPNDALPRQLDLL